MRRVALVLTVAAVVAGVGTLVSEVALVHLYRPHPPQGPNPRLGAWNLRCTVLLAWLTVAAAATTVWCWRTRRAVVAGAVAVVGSQVAGFSRGLVRWDQLALWRVTIGTDIRGYWPAAFDKDVRFVLVGGSEVSQTTYRLALVLHLLAPVVALIALGALLRILLVWGGMSRPSPTTRSSPSTVPTSST